MTNVLPSLYNPQPLHSYSTVFFWRNLSEHYSFGTILDTVPTKQVPMRRRLISTRHCKQVIVIVTKRHRECITAYRYYKISFNSCVVTNFNFTTKFSRVQIPFRILNYILFDIKRGKNINSNTSSTNCFFVTNLCEIID